MAGQLKKEREQQRKIALFDKNVSFRATYIHWSHWSYTGCKFLFQV